MGILRLVHDAHGLRLAHVAQHDVLLHGAGLHHGLVHGVAAFLDAVRRQVAARRARIAHNHGKVAGLVALQADGCPRLRVVGHVVLRVLGGAVGLRVGIDAEHGEVARLARPHPVVGLTAVLTHRLGHGEHQSHVLKVAVGGAVVLVALVERLHLNAQRGVLLADSFLPDILNGIDEILHLAELQLVHAEAVQFVGDILLVYHEADEEVLVGQFLLVGVGHEAVQHIVVLDGAVASDSVEAAVVVGEYQAVGRHDDARTVAAEVNHVVLDGIVRLVELLHGQLEAVLLHLCVDGRRQVVECPHALVGLGGEG